MNDTKTLNNSTESLTGKFGGSNPDKLRARLSEYRAAVQREIELWPSEDREEWRTAWSKMWTLTDSLLADAGTLAAEMAAELAVYRCHIRGEPSSSSV